MADSRRVQVMPQRRASAAGQTPASSSTRVHKTNGSVYSGATPHSPHSSTQPLPRSSAGLPNTPHQKIVSILVQRLKHKLPCNAGTTLTELENDRVIAQTIIALADLAGDSLDLIAYALTDQLQRLTQMDSNYRGVDVLQSQLFLLKVLSVAMASRLQKTEDTRPNSRAGKGSSEPDSLPSSPSPSTHASRGRHPSYDKMSMHSTSDIPPLVEDTAKYVLSIMIVFLRQSAPPAPRVMSAANLNFNASYQDFESVESQEGPDPRDHPNGIPLVSSKPKAMYELREDGQQTPSEYQSVKTSTVNSLTTIGYEPTSSVVSESRLSLNSLIGKFAGKVIYHLSASNWPVVFERIRNKIRELSNSSENVEIADLHLLMHCALDRIRLVQSLQELSSLLVNMRREAQIALCVPLRSAIWNWIERYPDEFNECLASTNRRLEGAPERVFDLLYGLHDIGDVWPALAVLLCVSPDRMKREYASSTLSQETRHGVRKERNFVDQIIKTMSSQSKLCEIALICALDICRAASRVRPSDAYVALPSVALDIAHEVKSVLHAWGTERRPFWSTSEDIDVALMGDALVTVYRFVPMTSVMPLFHNCLEATRSDAVKICVVKACITLVSEATLMPWLVSPEDLRVSISARITAIYRASVMRRSETDAEGIIRKPALRPKGRRYTAETVADRELLSLAVLALYRADINWFLSIIDIDTELYWVPGAVELWMTPCDTSVKVSMNRTTRFAFDTISAMSPSHPVWLPSASWMACAMPATLAAVCMNLLDTRIDFKSQALQMGMAEELMTRFTKDSRPHFSKIQMSVERIPAFLIAEMAFLVCLTSADRTVSAQACQCLRQLAKAERAENAPFAIAFTDEERTKRHPLYDQLGADEKSVLGRVAHQKRIRKIVRLLTLPPAVHMAVWQECYFRWCTLNELAVRMSLDDEVPGFMTSDRNLSVEDRQAQWYNLTMFMASLGPPVMKEGQELTLNGIVREEYLPDQMRILREPYDLMHIYLTQVINLLISDSPQARKVAEETLGAELNPRLYLRILKDLDNVLQQITDTASIDWDSFSTFLDSYIPIATILLENIQTVHEVHNIDMGETLRNLANLIMRFPGATGYRHKTKFCVLCETAYDPKTIISPRKDTLKRQEVAELIIEWAVDPTMVDAEFKQSQRDLNIATLKAAVKMLENLSLEAPQGLAEDDAAHFASRLFIRYVYYFQRVSEFSRSETMRNEAVSEQMSMAQHRALHVQDGSVHDLVIIGLASLISSNTEFGIKHCLPLAYDQNLTKQTTFTNVFARVLDRGVKLSTRDVSSTVSRQSKLCELIKGPEPSLAIAIANACDGNKDNIPEIIDVLLNVFDSKTALVNVLKAMIDKEVSTKSNDAELFRNNDFNNVFMSTCARHYGYNYLRSLLLPLLKTIDSLPPGHSFEIDPLLVGAEAAAKNQKIVERVASSFIDIITSSVPAFPSMFREVCAYIVTKVTARWSKAKFTALGAFIFLRFINPCIVFPERVDLPSDPKMSPGLKLVAKIIQNLANNVLFGKEAHMQSLNNFLHQKIQGITTFLSNIARHTPSGSDEEHEEWLETQYDDTDTILLQRYFMDHVDKIGKDLLSNPTLPDESALDSEATSKSSWQAICSAIYESNVHTEIPIASDATTEDHLPYKELITRFALRDVSSVRHIFAETHIPKYERAVFVLSVSKIDVEVLDLELLLYYILQTLNLPHYVNKDFEIIFDWANFSSLCNVPIQWIKFAYEVIPKDIRERLRVCRFLMPNEAALRYMRRLAVLVNGGPFAEEYVVHSSVEELLGQFPPDTSIPPLSEACQQEQEPREQYNQIDMRVSQSMHIPIQLEIAATHLRITTTRRLSYCRTLKAKAVEMIPLADISDAYNVSTGHDPHEFVIRKTRQGSTLYFVSADRDAIVKTVRTAKGNVRNTQRLDAERFSKLSNVVATLLHIAVLHIGSRDDELRAAAYDLLCAICEYLDYDGRPVMPAKSAFVPGFPEPFVVALSEKLAPHAPGLTLDFIAAVSSMNKTSVSQKISCLQYLSPWIRNFPLFLEPENDLFEPSGTKFRDCIRSLIDLTLSDTEVYAVLQKHIWGEVGRLQSNVVNVVLDELMRAAVDGGLGSVRCEVIADVMTAVTSINVRGRIFARIRKVLGKTSTKPTKDLAENSHWAEIACLTRLAMVANYHPRNLVHSQLFVPEAAHLVTIIAGTGDLIVRHSAYGIIVNLLNAVYLARAVQEGASLDVKALLTECVDPANLRCFGLYKPSQSSDFEAYDPETDKERIDLLENLTLLLGRVMKSISGSTGLLNVWRARWMSLITSSAFQFSPAIQTRAFISMGMLASSDVDDDLLYQMLVAFKTALSNYNEKEPLAMISMLRCMYRVVPALPSHSRYLPQLFWLAVALLETGYVMIYAEAIQLLRVTVDQMNADKEFEKKGIALTLMEARVSLEAISTQLDNLLSLSFHTSFHFSLAAIIFKGVRHSGLSELASGALRSLLRATVQNCGDPVGHENPNRHDPICPEAIGYFISLLPLNTTPKAYNTLLEVAMVHPDYAARSDREFDNAVPISFGLLGVRDRQMALLVTSFVSAMLQTAQGDDKETEMLYHILSEMAHYHPETIGITFDSFQEKLRDAFLNSSRPKVIEYLSNIFRVATMENRGLRGQASNSTLGTVDESSETMSKRHERELEHIDMTGIASPLHFVSSAHYRQVTKMINFISELVMKIIE